MSNKPKNVFAPMPPRCFRDDRLSGRHLRLLAIVALHDRLGRNGRGCTASLRRLGRLLGWYKGDVSYVMSELRSFGYIVETVSETNRRTHVRHVVYNDKDRIWDQEGGRTPIVEIQDDHPAQPKVITQPNHPASPMVSTQPNHPHCEGWVPAQPMVSKNHGQISVSPCADRQNGSEAYASKQIRKIRGKLDMGKIEADRAEARIRKDSEEGERYLTECEAILSSPDRDSLKYERKRIAALANDARLPEQVNERAARLLSQIPES
jgi:hypothetical protein